MKKYFILAATVILSLQVMAASLGDINGTCWHDGWAFYNVTEKDGELSFEGGTLHEGGYGFKVILLKYQKNGIFSIPIATTPAAEPMMSKLPPTPAVKVSRCQKRPSSTK